MKKLIKSTLNLFILSVLVLSSAAYANDRSGAWSNVFDWPFIPIHQVLDKEGKVFVFGGNRDGGQGGLSYLSWDPELGSGPNSFDEYDNTTNSDLFCAAQIVDPLSGDIFTFGGNPTISGRQNNNITTVYQSTSKQINDINTPMHSPRWYGTATTLPHGDILMQGGIPRCCNGQEPQITPEIYQDGIGWRSLFGARSRAAYGRFPEGREFFNRPETEERWWYPRSYVTPNGKVLGIASTALFLVDPSADGKQTFFTKYPYESMGATSSGVMYQPGKILQMGGSLHSSNSRGVDGVRMATIIDSTTEPPNIRSTTPMNIGRHWHTATVLADGKVLVTGGSTENNTLRGVANRAELWDPATEEWTLLAEGDTARLYHSTALLLPDGSVSVGGGGAPGPLTNKNAEIFFPPYLYSGGSRINQQRWTSAPSQMTYGRPYQLRLDSARKISRVTFVKTGAVTHSFNNDQRFIELEFTQNGSNINLVSPPNAMLATPGNYLLYAIDSNGHPSIGSIINMKTTNLALGKNVRQSSNFNPNFLASNANDGDRDGVARNFSMSHTLNDKNAFWEIDLGANYRIDTLNIWNRTDCCADRLKDFRILVSDKPFNSDSLAAANASGVKQFRFPGTAQQKEFFNIGMNGRYVRVQLAGTGYLQLAEVEILGAPITQFNNISPSRSLKNTFTRFRINDKGDYIGDLKVFTNKNIKPKAQRLVGMTSDGNGNYWLLRDDRLSPYIGSDRYIIQKVDANGKYLGVFFTIKDRNIVPSKQVLKGLAFDGQKFWLLRNDLLSYGINRWIMQAVDSNGRYTGDNFAINNPNIIPTRQFLYGLSYNTSSGNFWLLRDDLESYNLDRWIVQEINPQGRYTGKSFELTDRNSSVTGQTYHGLVGESNGDFSILRDDRNNSF